MYVNGRSWTVVNVNMCVVGISRKKGLVRKPHSIHCKCGGVGQTPVSMHSPGPLLDPPPSPMRNPKKHWLPFSHAFLWLICLRIYIIPNSSINISQIDAFPARVCYFPISFIFQVGLMNMLWIFKFFPTWFFHEDGLSLRNIASQKSDLIMRILYSNFSKIYYVKF